MAIGIVAVIATSSSYAAVGKSGHTIKACAAKKGGALRIATHCKSRERAITWNSVGPRGATGPAGPGAKLLTYDVAAGSATGSETRVGTIGPWVLYGACSIDNTGTVSTSVFYTGPAVTLDSSSVYSTQTGASQAITTSTPMTAQSLADGAELGAAQAYSGGLNADAVTLTWISGTARWSENLIVTAAAIAYTGSSNSCHFSSVATPLS